MMSLTADKAVFAVRPDSQKSRSTSLPRNHGNMNRSARRHAHPLAFNKNITPTCTDVDSRSYVSLLPGILESISKATYVAVDLEMSGIDAPKMNDNEPPSPNSSPTKQDSTEAAYQKARKAASLYTIFQVGLTTMRETADGTYECHTYNIHVTPLFLRDVTNKTSTAMDISRRVDRNAMFSVCSLQFLMSHGFNLQNSLDSGVPYLSRQEEAKCESILRNTEPFFVDKKRLHAWLQDPELLEFQNRVIRKMAEWMVGSTRKQRSPLKLGIPPREALKEAQIALVHYVVQERFPACRATTKLNGSYVRVDMKDKSKKKQASEEDLAARREVIAKQTGLRILFEALVGGEFAKYIPPMWMDARAEVRERISSVVQESESRFNNGQPPVLVAHNALYDLCFIYETFFGALPKTLNEFKREIHSLFPRILDTRLICLKDPKAEADTSLAKCFRNLRGEQLPKIRWMAPPNFPRRAFKQSNAHEAGYDSYMTAVVALKQAYRLSKMAPPREACPSPLPSPLPSPSSAIWRISPSREACPLPLPSPSPATPLMASSREPSPSPAVRRSASAAPGPSSKPSNPFATLDPFSSRESSIPEDESDQDDEGDDQSTVRQTDSVPVPHNSPVLLEDSDAHDSDSSDTAKPECFSPQPQRARTPDFLRKKKDWTGLGVGDTTTKARLPTSEQSEKPPVMGSDRPNAIPILPPPGSRRNAIVPNPAHQRSYSISISPVVCPTYAIPMVPDLPAAPRFGGPGLPVIQGLPTFPTAGFPGLPVGPWAAASRAQTQRPSSAVPIGAPAGRLRGGSVVDPTAPSFEPKGKKMGSALTPSFEPKKMGSAITPSFEPKVKKMGLAAAPSIESKVKKMGLAMPPSFKPREKNRGSVEEGSGKDGGVGDYGARLPPWGCEFWEVHGNLIPLGKNGVLRLLGGGGE